MVRPTKKTSHRATVKAKQAQKALKSMANLQTLFENMGIDSLAPIPPPGYSQASAADPYIADPRVRFMLERLIKWVLFRCNLIQWELPSASDRENYVDMENHIESDAFKNLCVMTSTKMYLWMPSMKYICRESYFPMTSSSQNYVKYLFKALRQIHARRLPFYDNMVAGFTFVLCTTAYFCHNGFDQALKHAYRVLTTHFESQLRIPFSRAGGFPGLSNFCLDYDIPDFLGGYLPRPEAYDIEEKLRFEAESEIGEFVHTLSIGCDGDSDDDPLDVILTTLAFANHLDLTVKRSRSACGEWIYKDCDLPQLILKNMKTDRAVEKRAQSPMRVEQLRDTIHANSIVDPDILNAFITATEEFISSMYLIDKMAESIID